VTGRAIRGLYVIIDPDACRGRAPAEVARAAIAGGATIVQWRDKRRAPDAQMDDARAVQAACRDGAALFIVNDDSRMAAELGADGVHVGQDDMAPGDARTVVGEAIIGVSTNNVAEARRAEAAGADYVAVGAIFPTRTKDVTRPASIERLREVRASVRVPVVAIGGIDATNVRDVVGAGADAVAVISAVCGADDPRSAAEAIRRAAGW
jgi:thiamine-phosphate diphosphorylase